MYEAFNRYVIETAKMLYFLHSCRGYPPEHIPGQSSLLENSEDMSPRGTPNQSAVVVTVGDSEGEEGEFEDTIGELQKMKLDDSALSTQVNNQKGLRVGSRSSGRFTYTVLILLNTRGTLHIVKAGII